MTASQEIHERATLYGWSVHRDPFGDLLVRGNRAVQVSYTSSGAVRDAESYRFASLKNLHLESQTRGRDKKQTVISWLAGAA